MMVYRTFQHLDTVFTALSEPTRRAVLERLTLGDATVTELAAPFPMSLQAFLKHVRVLEEAGLVQRTRIGRTNHVHLLPEALQAAAGWLNARTPAASPPLAAAVPCERRADMHERARLLHASLSPRIALLRRAVEGQPPPADSFEPADAAVRALQAARRRPVLEEALRLFDALTRALEEVADGGELEALQGLILPLGRLMHELRPLLPADETAA